LIPVARRLERAGARVVGLVPAGRHAAAFELAPHLAGALRVVSGATVAVVPPLSTWPAAGAAAGAHEGSPDDGQAIDPGALAGLAVIAPAAAPDLAAAVRGLDNALAEAVRFDRVIVDLAGFEAVLGDVLVLFDGVVLVAAARRTREGDLLALHGLVGRRRDLGVLVVGP
jgi:hypothetical protein